MIIALGWSLLLADCKQGRTHNPQLGNPRRSQGDFRFSQNFNPPLALKLSSPWRHQARLEVLNRVCDEPDRICTEESDLLARAVDGKCQGSGYLCIGFLTGLLAVSGYVFSLTTSGTNHGDDLSLCSPLMQGCLYSFPGTLWPCCSVRSVLPIYIFHVTPWYGTLFQYRKSNSQKKRKPAEKS